MNNVNYQYFGEKMEELTNRSLIMLASFYQNLLIASATVLGLVSALSDASQHPLPIRVVFASFVVLASLSCILCGIVAYIFAYQGERICQNFGHIVLRASKKHQQVPPIVTPLPRYTSLIQKMLYIFLLLSLIALVSYSLMLVFF